MLRDALVYRKASFTAGLRVAGYKVVDRIVDPDPEDLLLVWNRYSHYDVEARRFEHARATVLVTENAHLRDGLEGRWFSLAKNHHSGAGTWNVGGSERWDDLGVQLHPWREAGKEILILGQRGIGEPGIAAPRGWAEGIKQKIGGRIRSHPGNSDALVPLEHDLRHARCCVTWHSAAALTALIHGIPCFYAFPKWIGAQAALPLSAYPCEPKCDDQDRLRMFQRLIWSQWELSEIEDGSAFRQLLNNG